jgi:Polyketide cyclase / dehydrase and lipid transport
MGNRHVSVMINAPPETVFGLYTDPGRAHDWLSGVREIRTAGPPDQPGSQAVFVYRWPFKMTAEVLRAEPSNLHVQRLKELLGLVTCTTTARLRRVEDGTELRLDMNYRVAGGPIGRPFDARVGDEMVATAGGDLARLKALAEEQAGPRRDNNERREHAASECGDAAPD